MFDNKNELEARQEILGIVDEYCKKYHNQKQYKEGDRISYVSRVYDSKEMINLVASALGFWLTAGRYTAEFEKKLVGYLGVKCVSVVNSGSSANLNAFMALTSPLLGDRRIRRGDEIITVAAGFPTTITPAIQYGAVPVFVDVTIPHARLRHTGLAGRTGRYHVGILVLFLHPDICRTHLEVHHPVSYTHLCVPRSTPMAISPLAMSSTRRLNWLQVKRRLRSE